MLRNFVHVAVCAVALGCNDYNKVLKSPDLDYKFERAVAYVDSGKCMGALPILDELSGLMRGTELAREVQWHLARAHYCVNDLYLARYHYKSFAKAFPYDLRAEEASFLSAACSYRLSPDASLDQTETRAAIEELQLFMNRYPSSALRDSSQQLITTLRRKLDDKDFDLAALYHTTGQFKAATLALAQHLRDHPDSPHREQALWLILDAHFQYASLSTDRRKIERYSEAIAAFHNFVARYPKSQHAADAQRIYDACIRRIDELKDAETSSSPTP
jgi:outer membrane protein assembly factor BamD